MGLACRGFGQAEGDGDVWRDGQGRSVGGDGQRDGLGELAPSVRRLRRGVPYLKRGRSGGSIWLHGEPSLFLVPMPQASFTSSRQSSSRCKRSIYRVIELEHRNYA